MIGSAFVGAYSSVFVSVIFLLCLLSPRQSLLWINSSHVEALITKNVNPNCNKVSIVTGANGYIGRHIVHQLLSSQEQIICLVRPSRVPSEAEYWRYVTSSNNKHQLQVTVMPYDMLDGGTTLETAILQAAAAVQPTVYHAASVFGPTGELVFEQ